MKFKSFGEFADYLIGLQAKKDPYKELALESACKVIEKESKDEIGTYQPQVGPYDAWDPLAESTRKEKIRLGYADESNDNPLLRTGELRDSITHEVEGNKAVVGSTSEVMVYQELGTSKMPARPVLAPAAFKNKEKIEQIFGKTFKAYLGGKNIAKDELND